MNTIYKRSLTVFAVVFIGLGLVSCNKDFLEVSPKGKLIAESFRDYDLLFNNSSLINLSNTGQVVLGDDVAAVDPYFTGASLTTQRLFRWEDVVYEPEQYAVEMSGLTKNIYIYNKIIKEIDGVNDATDEQKNRLKAEAKAGRAWANLMLINYYGKPYNPSTASSDPGYPIVTAAEVTQTKFERGTVQQMYDFIVQDLNESIPYLPEKITHRVRLAKPAAQGILAKTLIYMGRFEEALPLLNSAIASLTLADVPVRLYDYNKAFLPGQPLASNPILGVGTPLVHLNEENVWGRFVNNFWASLNNEIVLSPKARALFGSSDKRLTMFSPRTFMGAAAYPSGLMKRNGYNNIQWGVLLPELYLFRAECNARAGSLTAAVEDLELLRKNRMPAADAVVPTERKTEKMELLTFIMEERIREFAVAGYRYYDMRRLSVDPLFGPEEYTHTLFNAKGEQTHFKMKQERLTFQFPQKIINENPGMLNNP